MIASIVEINDPLELDSLRLTWKLLLSETRRASFFQSLDWLQTYWNHFGHDQRLRVLVARWEGKTPRNPPVVCPPGADASRIRSVPDVSAE